MQDSYFFYNYENYHHPIDFSKFGYQRIINIKVIYEVNS